MTTDSHTHTPTPAKPPAAGSAPLAACPFCGGAANVFPCNARRGGQEYYSVGCSGRMCPGNQLLAHPNREAAIAAWNRRAPPAAAPAPDAAGDAADRALVEEGERLMRDRDNAQDDLGYAADMLHEWVDCEVVARLLALARRGLAAPTTQAEQPRPASEAVPGKTYWLRWPGVKGHSEWAVARRYYGNDGWEIRGITSFDDVLPPLADAEVVELVPPPTGARGDTQQAQQQAQATKGGEA